MTTTKLEQIQSRVVTAIAEQLGMETSGVTPEKNFHHDLGSDSLDDIEIVMALEDEFDLEIGDEDAEKCNTVQDAINLIVRLQTELGRV